MTLENLYKLLCSSGLPVEYRQCAKPTEPPFIIYMEQNRDKLLADDTIYAEWKNVDIELYTPQKSPEAEAQIEEILRNADIIYNFIDIGVIEGENMYEVVYEIQI